MNLRFWVACAAVAGALVAPGAANAATHYVDFTTDQEYGPIFGQMILDVDGSGNVTSGSASMHGAGLLGTVAFNVVTTHDYGGTTGWRAGDGTDLFGGDTSFPIDANGLVFNSGPWGSGYVFGVYSDGAGGYQNALFGQGGAGNFYSYNVPIALREFTAQASGVPEPSTWAMLMIGFAGLGYAAFRHGRSESLSRSIA